MPKRTLQAREDKRESRKFEMGLHSVATGYTLRFMAERVRERMVNVRMTDEEYEMLSAVAEHDGMSLSNWLRQSFRQAFRKLFPEAKPTARKKAPRG